MQHASATYVLFARADPGWCRFPPFAGPPHGNLPLQCAPIPNGWGMPPGPPQWGWQGAVGPPYYPRPALNFNSPKQWSGKRMEAKVRFSSCSATVVVCVIGDGVAIILYAHTSAANSYVLLLCKIILCLLLLGVVCSMCINTCSIVLVCACRWVECVCCEHGRETIS